MSGKVVPASVLVTSYSSHGQSGPVDGPSDILVADMDADDYDILGDHKMALSLRGVEIVIDMNSVPTQPETRLSKMAKLWRERSEGKQDKDRAPLYVNRNPEMLQCILDYHVSGELHLVDDVCGRQLRLELAFWGLGEELVSACCLWKLSKGQDKAETMQTLHSEFEETEKLSRDARTWKQRLWAARNDPFGSRIGMVFHCTVTALYMTFLLVMVLGTQPAFRSPRNPDQNATYASAADYIRNNPVDPWLNLLDLVLLLVLMFVFISVVWVCPDKRLFLTTPSNLVFAVSMAVQFLPVTVFCFWQSPLPAWYQRHGTFYCSLRVARIAPIYHALAPFKCMRVLVRALVASYRELLLLVVLLLMSTVIYGYLMFLSEAHAEGGHVWTLLDGFWWALVTMTTVGYGDMYPVTHPGRLLGALCACTGIIVIALPVPIIARNFTHIYDLVNVAEYQRSLINKARNRKLEDVNENTPSAVKVAF